jgi:hypothetical protein
VSRANAPVAPVLRLRPITTASTHTRHNRCIRAQYVPTHVCGRKAAERCALGCSRQEDSSCRMCCFRKSAGVCARGCVRWCRVRLFDFRFVARPPLFFSSDLPWCGSSRAAHRSGVETAGNLRSACYFCRPFDGLRECSHFDMSSPTRNPKKATDDPLLAIIEPALNWGAISGKLIPNSWKVRLSCGIRP